MKLLFCLFKYFPFGGLQRDFLRIAQTCEARGHTIHVLTMRWEGEIPAGFEVSQVRARALTNHGRAWSFAERAKQYLRDNRYDRVVGFNKMPGLDVYYAADPCFRHKVMTTRHGLYRFTPRSRSYCELERSVFDASARAHILMIAPGEKEHYVRWYDTPPHRFHNLPPGISRDRVQSGDVHATRRSVRAELGMGDEEILLLSVGSGFKTKGLDRSIRAMASLPDSLRARARLIVIGEGKRGPFERMAREHGVLARLHFLGGRNDVPRFLAAADLLLHPAYSENTGTVLLEAMASGLPVLASDVCGYAVHVKKAAAGLLIASPYRQAVFDELLRHMLTTEEKSAWRRNGRRYAEQTDIFSMPDHAAAVIESLDTQS